MIAPNKNYKKEFKWFIVITKKDSHYDWHCGVEERYSDLVGWAESEGYEITAEQRELSDCEIDIITGYKIMSSAKEKSYLEEGDIEDYGEHHLDNLVDRLNSREIKNPKKVFSDLILRLITIVGKGD